MDADHRRSYWKRNVRLMTVLLSIWALVSFGFAIILAEPLNRIVIGGYPMGFWWAQQGSIVVFVLLIAFYVWRMDKLDAEYGITEYEQEIHHS